VDHHGPDADVFVVYARPTRRRSARYQRLHRRARHPRFSTAPKLDKLGMPRPGTCELLFDDCPVPAENLLGPRTAARAC